ncbi:MAG: hypothetical protein J0L76_20125 [Rhodobacterales bacterium]|nr:hypothetical protein [Rhodobacterales bacterium]
MIRLTVPALVALTAFPAVAQEANGLSFGGEVKLEYVDADSSAWVLDGDVGLSWRSGGLLGFDAALDSTHIDDGTDLTNAWAALVLSTGAGEFAVGAPRPLTDSLSVMPRFSSSRAVDLTTGFFRGPLTSIASFADNGLTPGITYRQTSGNLTFGGGYHHLNDENIDIAEGIMRYESGATTYFISGEFATAPGPDVSLMQIGVFHDDDRFDLGAAFAQIDDGDAVNSLRLYGSYDVMPALTLRGDALLIQDSGDIYSMSATYNTESGLFVEGGGTKVGGEAEIYDIGVGFKF